jgi:hypothetical protein
LVVKDVVGGRSSRSASAGTRPYPTATAPSGISATSSPTPSASAEPVDLGPFAGTPADSFPSGADGITLPTAQATGAWSAEQVAADLAKVKAALIASHLDHRLLISHDPSRFLALMASYARGFWIKQLQAGKFGVNLVRIASSAHLAADSPRVSGRTTYRATTWNHVDALEIITNYVWVYPFAVPASGSGSNLVIVHSEERWYFPKSGEVAAASRGLNLGYAGGFWDRMDCAESDKGFTAPFSGSDPSALPDVHDSEAPDAYFQPDHTLNIVNDCR